MAGRRVIAKKLGVSVARVRQLIQAGVLPDKPRGEHDPEECLRLYLARLRSTAAGTSGNVPRDPGLRELRRQRDLVELDFAKLALARATGEVVPISAVAARVAHGFTTLRQQLISIGSRVADHIITASTRQQAAQIVNAEIEARWPS